MPHHFRNLSAQACQTILNCQLFSVLFFVIFPPPLLLLLLLLLILLLLLLLLVLLLLLILLLICISLPLLLVPGHLLFPLLHLLSSPFPGNLPIHEFQFHLPPLILPATFLLPLLTTTSTVPTYSWSCSFPPIHCLDTLVFVIRARARTHPRPPRYSDGFVRCARGS